jgi:ribonuclease HII
LAKPLESRRKEPPLERTRKPRRDWALVREETYRRLVAFDREVAERDGWRKVLAGVDEAGRGALAGPVVTAAVILPPDPELVGVDDSKRLSENRRETLFDQIVSAATAVTIACGHPRLIDERNILQATLMMMHRAVSRLRPRPELVLVDGRDTFQWDGTVVAVKRGDSKSLAVAAASIVAKVARDRLMRKLHVRYPHYNFMSNKGYGSKEHLQAILSHGSASVHRRSFHAKVVENPAELFLL